MKRFAFRAVDPSSSSHTERQLARHIRFGVIDLALFAFFWLCVWLDIWPPVLAAVATGLFALIWTTQFVGYRLVLRQEQHERTRPTKCPLTVRNGSQGNAQLSLTWSPPRSFSTASSSPLLGSALTSVLHHAGLQLG
jgi:hypothetical protein